MSAFDDESECESERELQVRLDCDRFRGIRDELGGKPQVRRNPYDVAMQYLVPVAIISNAGIMGYAADRPPLGWVPILEHVYTAFFAQEMFIALYREGRRDYFNDPWHYLDFSLAWLSILDTWVLGALVVEGPLSAFMVLRVLRVLRVMRLLRVLKVKKELLMMTAGIVSSIQTTCWMMVLLLIVIFAAGLFCMSAISIDEYVGIDFDASAHFGTLARSMMTMFNVMILDGWADLIWPVFYTQPTLVVFFIMFLMLTSFGAMNVVVGIVTEQAMLVSRNHQEMELEKCRRQHMRDIMILADSLFEGAEGEGLTSQQLNALAKDRADLMDELRAVDFPRGFGMDDLHCMFDDEYSESLTKDEFINGMFRIVFNNEFQRDCCIKLHIARLRQAMHISFQQLREDLERSMGISLQPHLERRHSQAHLNHRKTAHELPEDPDLTTEAAISESHDQPHLHRSTSHRAHSHGQSHGKHAPGLVHAASLASIHVRAEEKKAEFGLHESVADLKAQQQSLSQQILGMQGLEKELKGITAELHQLRALEGIPEELRALQQPLSLVYEGQGHTEGSLGSLHDGLVELEHRLSDQGQLLGEMAELMRAQERVSQAHDRATRPDSRSRSQPRAALTNTMFTGQRAATGQRSVPSSAPLGNPKMLV